MKQFRIPVVGAYTTRIGKINLQGPYSGYVGIGIVGLMVVGKTAGATQKDAKFVNCFAETVTDPVTGKKRVYSVKRPGWASSSTPEAGSIGNQILLWTGNANKVISAFGATNSNIYDGVTLKGAITGKATGLVETKAGANVPTVVISSTDNTGWYHDTTVPTKIADVDFPGNAGKTLAGTFVQMDGFTGIMDTTGVLWVSDLNSVTAWTSNSFDSANAYPDAGVGAIRWRHMIMCFGAESCEFFYNAGATPFPFAKETAKTMKVGAVHADAITSISDVVFWVGSTPKGGLSVFQYDGVLKKISTPDIDTVLILAGSTNISLSACRYFGRSFLRVKAAEVIYTCCIEENNFWFEESSLVPLATKISATSIGNAMVNYAVSNVSTSGKVFVMNHAAMVFQDNGAPYTSRMQLDSVDLGTRRMKFWSELEVVADVEIESSPLTISYSDDDFTTVFTRGTVDLSENRPRFTRLGSSRRRDWILTHAANTPHRIEAIEGTVDIGA